MPDIRIHRTHALGLKKAREVAWAWAEEVEKKFDMECAVLEGETSDTVEFARSGVKGELVIGGGTSQIQKNIISERGLGLPKGA